MRRILLIGLMVMGCSTTTPPQPKPTPTVRIEPLRRLRIIVQTTATPGTSGQVCLLGYGGLSIPCLNSNGNPQWKTGNLPYKSDSVRWCSEQQCNSGDHCYIGDTAGVCQ